MNVNFFVLLPYFEDHGFLLPWQNSGLLSGTHFTATLGGGRAGSFTTRAFFFRLSFLLEAHTHQSSFRIKFSL